MLPIEYAETNKLSLCTSFYFWNYTKYFGKLHLHTRTSAILNLSYLAFCRFCGGEPLLFGTSDLFCILYLVLGARSVRRLLVCCIPKPLLFCTFAICHISYLAPLLFRTSSV